MCCRQATALSGRSIKEGSPSVSINAATLPAADETCTALIAMLMDQLAQPKDSAAQV